MFGSIGLALGIFIRELYRDDCATCPQLGHRVFLEHGGGAAFRRLEDGVAHHDGSGGHV